MERSAADNLQQGTSCRAESVPPPHLPLAIKEVWEGALIAMDDVRFNGRQREGDRRRVFVCRLTDRRVAVVLESPEEEAQLLYFPDLAEAKRQIAFLVPDARIPMYEPYELSALTRKLNGLSTGKAI